MPTSSGHVAVATRTSTWAGASSSAMRRIKPEVLRRHGLVHEHRGAVREPAEELDDGGVLGRGGDLLAEQREQLDGLVVAEDQRVADDRVAALVQPGQQRVVRFGEIDAEQRGEQPAQPEVLEQHDLAAAHAAAGGHVERQRQAAPRAVPARQRRRGAQPVAPARRGQAGFEGDADPAGEPVETGFRGDRRVGQQVRMGDAILERRQHALEVGEEAREEVRPRRPRPVDPDRFLVAAVLANRFADQPPGRRARPDPSAASGGPAARRERRAAPDPLPTPRAPRRARRTECRRRPARRRAPASIRRPARRASPRPRRARLRDRAAAGSARHSRSGSHTREAPRCPARCGRRRTARPAPTGSGRRGGARARVAFWISDGEQATPLALGRPRRQARVIRAAPTAPAPTRRAARAGPSRRRRAPRCRARSRAGARRPSRPPPAAAPRRWRRARRRSRVPGGIEASA